MDDVFGTPNAHDGTAEREILVEEVGQDHAEMKEFVRTEMMNRRIGSKKVSTKDQIQEYEVIKGMARENNVQPGMGFLTSQDATLEETVNYFWDMEHKIRNA